MSPTLPAVMTPGMIAKRWSCSERHVRNLITTGELPSFRLGKLLRVRGADVENLECQNGGSTDIAAATASLGWTGQVRRRYTLETSDPKEAARRAPGSIRRAHSSTREGGRGPLARIPYRYGRPPGHVDDGSFVESAQGAVWWARFKKSITIADCRAHIAERRQAGRKDGTIHTELGHLRMVLLWAEKHGLIKKAPMIERPGEAAPKRQVSQ